MIQYISETEISSLALQIAVAQTVFHCGHLVTIREFEAFRCKD